MIDRRGLTLQNLAIAGAGPALWIFGFILAAMIFWGDWPPELAATRLNALVIGFWIAMGLLGLVLISLTGAVRSVNLGVGKLLNASANFGDDAGPAVVATTTTTTTAVASTAPVAPPDPTGLDIPAPPPQASQDADKGNARPLG